ncbi:MAG: hypothetical protein JWQ89_3574 [Devosia sp.]|uniref:HEPN domain-containing protein n=1 Tax=Devosia sp. TaxID=1871048 RepID=UPI002619F223|nr:HEPN domain-containing protein [Devosia sp.]MDB5541847.1 hypothetical protein [Devosia sp.]
MAIDQPTLFGDMYVGLAGIRVTEPAVFPRGIRLEPTYAHLMEPLIMAFKPAEAGKPHPGPWKSAYGGTGTDITAQLFVPQGAASDPGKRMELAWLVAFLIRIWTTPEVTMVAMSSTAFSEMESLPDQAAMIIPFGMRRRDFTLVSNDPEECRQSLVWEADHFETAERLMRESTELTTAAYALDAGQYTRDHALTLISLWGALEALFSPSTSELRFRVSALLAAYLYEPGEERLDQQKRIAALYDKRSAAAHGKPKHGQEDLVATFELLRRVIMRMIEQGFVPTRQQLDERLFGVS